MTVYENLVVKAKVADMLDPEKAHKLRGRSQTEAELPRAEYDDEYYFQKDPMVTFLVEDCLFRIHRHFLLEGSPVFCGIFTTSGEGIDTKDASDGQPIPLPEVTKKEFKALLDHFYHPPHRQHHLKKNETDNLQFYIDLLSVSHRFVFSEIVQYAVGRLQPMITNVPAVQRFVLGEKFGLKEWSFSAYESLLDSRTTPTAQELEILGFDKVARLIGARDAMHRHHLQDITTQWKADVVSAENTGPSKDSKRSKQTAPTIIQVSKPLSKNFVQQFFES